ncbi:Glu-tRNA(Gln) amidotransferase subunit GatE [Candidatus Woesearchaeota archaeon]|nr:Glu-tRNA(Gln) amidotransferase subunit GatE [Candidatus Woesearchaeota archaeon]
MINYKDLGLKIGLEIHQQLDTGKLFCRCPCIIKDDKPDFTVKRSLRISASELGEMDPAALYELQKGKYFVYQGYNDVNCLVELDENPPEELNKEALNIALQVALLLNAKPINVIQFMRKIVIDGSNVSGFQRTALVAINGYIETSEGKISISTICLEEEAAKKVEDTDKYRIYNISRLGIPLIEIATGPEIKSPLGAKEAAEKIGMILRSVKGIKRGIGSIRQDVNLSIKNTARVEIKGFQDLRSIPKVIEFEINRRLKILNDKKKLEGEVRKAEADLTTSFLRPMPGASRMYPETDVPLIYITKEMLHKIELPKLLDEKVDDLEELYSLQPEIARELIKQDINFDHFVSEYRNLDPNFIARVLVEIPKEIKSRLKLDSDKLMEDNFHAVLEFINNGEISKEAALDVLADLIKDEKINLNKYKVISDKELELEIKKIVETNPNVVFGGLMGDVMKKFKGKVDGRKVAELIRKYMK